MTDTTTSAVERLAKDTEIKSNMINMGERIQWGSETSLMDQCASTIRALAAERDKLREALALFADDESWKRDRACDPNSACFVGQAVARAALDATNA